MHCRTAKGQLQTNSEIVMESPLNCGHIAFPLGEHEHDMTKSDTSKIPISLGKVMLLYMEQSSIGRRSARNNVLSLLKILERAKGQPVKPETVPLTDVDETLIVRFQSEVVRLYCERAEQNDSAQREAKERALRSSRSTISQARSIFSKRGEIDMVKLYKANGIELPDSVNRFMSEKLRGKLTKADYKAPPDSVVESTFSAIELMRADVPLWLAFWIAAGTGLRRKEIHFAKWEYIFELDGRHWIRGGMGKDGEIICVPFQTRAFAAIEPYRKASGWIIEERSDRWAKRLCAWMSAQGWTTRLKIHELRALLGSMIYEKDPVQAMRQLRHKSIQVTEERYVRYKLLGNVVDVL